MQIIIIMAVDISWEQSLQPYASRDLNKGFFIFTFFARSEIVGSMVWGQICYQLNSDRLINPH